MAEDKELIFCFADSGQKTHKKGIFEADVVSAKQNNSKREKR